MNATVSVVLTAVIGLAGSLDVRFSPTKSLDLHTPSTRMSHRYAVATLALSVLQSLRTVGLNERGDPLPN